MHGTPRRGRRSRRPSCTPRIVALPRAREGQTIPRRRCACAMRSFQIHDLRANETAFCCIATTRNILLLTKARSQCQQQRGLDATHRSRCRGNSVAPTCTFSVCLPPARPAPASAPTASARTAIVARRAVLVLRGERLCAGTIQLLLLCEQSALLILVLESGNQCIGFLNGGRYGEYLRRCCGRSGCWGTKLHFLWQRLRDACRRHRRRARCRGWFVCIPDRCGNCACYIFPAPTSSTALSAREWIKNARAAPTAFGGNSGRPRADRVLGCASGADLDRHAAGKCLGLTRSRSGIAREGYTSVAEPATHTNPDPPIRGRRLTKLGSAAKWPTDRNPAHDRSATLAAATRVSGRVEMAAAAPVRLSRP
jgi:hypothetical protein